MKYFGETILLILDSSLQISSLKITGRHISCVRNSTLISQLGEKSLRLLKVLINQSSMRHVGHLGLFNRKTEHKITGADVCISQGKGQKNQGK